MDGTTLLRHAALPASKSLAADLAADLAWRDIQIARRGNSDETLADWRLRIEEEIRQLPRKIGYSPQLREATIRWKARLAELPVDATPQQVYSAADYKLLLFIGF